MEWYIIDNKNCFNYIVNASNNKYLCYDATNTNKVYMAAYDNANDNKYKFSITESPTAGTFNIYSDGQNKLINKANGNNKSDVIATLDYTDPNAKNGTARWKFVLPTSLDKTAPFTVSNPSTGNYTYYKLRSSGDGYYIKAPASADANATMVVAASADDNTYWYLEEAAAATNADWLTYYYIRNAKTGDYLYYANGNPSDNNAAFKASTTNGDADRYQFAWAHSTTADYYFIVPKMLLNQTLNNFSTMNRNSGTLRVQKVRDTGSSAWSFSQVPNSDFKCAQPVITWRAGDGGYVVTPTESDAKIYYKIGEGVLTPTTGTLYTGAISVAELGVESATIRVIAARNSDGSDASTEVSVSVSRVATPEISLTEDGKVEITCATPGASIFYEMDTTSPSNPTSSSTSYTGPIEGPTGKVIKAIAVKDEWINSVVTTSETIVFTCATPVIKKTSATTFTIQCVFPTSGVTIRYTKGDGTQADPTASTGTVYSEPVTFSESELPFTIKAIAVADGYTSSEVVTKQLTESLNEDVDGYYEIASADDFSKFIQMVTSGDADKKYKITANITLSDIDVISEPFTGELMGVVKADGTIPVISGLKHAIFNTINGGTVKNVILDNITISGNGNKGAIANEATGTSRIYNCGVLATDSEVETDADGYTHITTCSSTISSNGGYVGGIVGLLDGSSRVINCFSYANITKGNEVGGIVGHNNVATTSTNLQTMVMNCMFYGDIDDDWCTSIAPIYNGVEITNDGDADGVNNFNYFWAGASYVQGQNIDVYNCALAAETRFLQRFEFFRPLLNSNRELAAWWASTPTTTVTKSEIMKWVLEPSQIGTATPYPILKAPNKYYPSVVNIDADNAEEFSADADERKSQHNQGRKFGTLAVHIQNSTVSSSSTTAPYGPPANASITKSDTTLVITDKDPDHFNFNYGKVQLPYYNDVGTKNYTGNRVVTGWKIVSITGEGSGTHSFTTGSHPADATATVNNATGEISLTTPYNFADRKCTQKDLYGSGGSNRIFNQGAYWDVPDSVTAITIEPYWAKAVYLSDEYWDVTYKNGGTNGTDAMKTPASVTTVGGGQHYENGKKYDLTTHSLDETNGQIVYTSIYGKSGAIASSGSALFSGVDASTHSVYDYAVVLVGNYHHYGDLNADNNKPYTVTSIDLDGDNEPDYSYILRFDSRLRVHPVRIDFLNVIGLGMAQKSTGGTGTYNFGIMQPNGWFECTNTGLFRVTQFEYDLSPRTLSPIILQGGVMEQWVTYQNGNSTAADAVEYFHVGGNVWFKEFHMGVHQDRTDDKVTPHPPVSVTGGDFKELYLTGLYNSPNVNYPDNAECYINGGRFGKVAGTGMQGIGNTGGIPNEGSEETTGNIIWQIDNADIDEFYGGGINAAHISEGDIITVISNSRVDQFCGGPKFGDMNSDKKVVTNASNCTFRAFFGAGYGGNSYDRRYPYNQNNKININWDTWIQGNDGLKYRVSPTIDNKTYVGVETRIDYQFIPMSSNIDNVCRLFVDYVTFSLATTYDVTSKLTDCTVTTSPLGRLDLFDECLGNFYGGGSLGKVVGDVKSTLTNCTVEGNVFGAGYSASLPPVQVMDNKFRTQPHYDENLGAYLEAELPDTTRYTWVYRSTLGIDTNAKVLFTTIDLSKSNLGSVSGQVTLTLQGNTKVGTLNADNTLKEKTGDVYGGGDESYVFNEDDKKKAKTIVNIKGNTEVLGNVFGGGNRGEVSGSATVNIEE